ncbi:Zinc finger, RING/FYVE/PHD-type [Plasmopara halstedii]|uniref:Zinc finger, RING/FYVE/PHD-type n=1 Tax=Plasmopara halstedii TaxID=4781 RepID=A0A0P1A6S0_PLAHL|nr:Zinc finger, RING/FYVE/PHD-type [Plasmopara halstedii]CEG35871.1 Zinc finger, RING/FYVE/PHD-type [Plasmopara halstedii]|eukprot:XP_024572240.1 Zinc finger, RING/FYVE/PHD-type [Plasmopara halstedii]
MKFPLPHMPFGNYPALSEAQMQQIELTVQQTLSKALGDYEQNQLQVLPRSQYKVVKKVENLTCYRQRSTASARGATRHYSERITSRSSMSSQPLTSFLSPARYRNNGSDRPSPTLITVGTIAGTLNDVMYGLLATDATSTFIRASYTKEELLDTALLHSIRAPTPSKPFQFCGVKWQVTKLSSQRDFVFVEASGIVTRTNGDRVGYHIMHSVDLPGLDELADCYQVLRGRVMSCHLFRQLPHNTVDVYMKGIVDPNGFMRQATAIVSTASALLKFCHAVECSHNKKLEYFLEQEQLKRGDTLSVDNRRSNNLVTLSMTSRSASTCTVCATTFHLFRNVAYCELCSEAVCSRCRVTRRLSYRVARLKDLKQQNTTFCKACVAHASNYSAVNVARIELVVRSSLMENNSDGFNTLVSTELCRHLTIFSPSSSEDLLSQRNHLNTYDSSDQVRRRSVSSHSPAAIERLDAKDLVEADSIPRSTMSSTSCGYLDFFESVIGWRKTESPNANSTLIESENVCPLARSMPVKPSPSMLTSPLWHQRELMRRMEELRQNVESVYQLTWRNTQSMRSSGVRLVYL